jgi:carbon-monoxide dehydrogenase medium subunit
VKPAPFEYVAPRAADEALDALAGHGDEAKVLAGGQSLVPMLNFRLARPAVIVDINRVAGLDELVRAGATLRVGALVRQRRLERWSAGQAPLLHAGLRLIGHPAIRTRGTVGGSIAHADPAAELPALLLACDGTVVVRRRRGERVVPAAEFFLGPLLTALAPDELITETRWTLPPPAAGWGLHEVARRAGDFALVGAIAVLSVRGGRVVDPRVVVFGCGSRPARLPEAEAVLADRAPNAALLAEAARAGTATLEAHDDLHAGAAYRRRAARTLVARALADAVGRAKDQE